MNINNSTLVKDSDSLIRKKSDPVSLPLSKENENILMSMLQFVRDSKDEELSKKYDLRPAVGIAAPQIGILKQMIAISFVEEDKNGNEVLCEYALANPKIISYSAKQAYLKEGEGCLSVDEAHDGFVPRSARIKVQAYDLLNKKEVTIRANGYRAIVLQHEIDHLSGILFYDHINKIEPFRPIPDAIVIE